MSIFEATEQVGYLLTTLIASTVLCGCWLILWGVTSIATQRDRYFKKMRSRPELKYDELAVWRDADQNSSIVGIVLGVLFLAGSTFAIAQFSEAWRPGWHGFGVALVLAWCAGFLAAWILMFVTETATSEFRKARRGGVDFGRSLVVAAGGVVVALLLLTTTALLLFGWYVRGGM